MRKLIPVILGLPLIAAAVILAVSNLHAAVQGKPVGVKAADCCPAVTSAKAVPASADDCCDGGSCCH